MRRLHRAWLLAVLLAIVPCARAEDVTVFAAASLTEAMRDLAAAHERATGVHVVVSFGGSSDLARQITAGAPADLFFSADAAQMDKLVTAGLVDATARRDVLSNALVAVVPAGAPSAVKAPEDLTHVAHLAIANPDAVPAGVYARQYLARVGLWGRVQPAVVPTVDVRAALAAVAEGHAEAGLVYRTDAATSPKVTIAFEVPADQTPAIVYPLAPLKASAGKATVAALFARLTSAEARAVYERHGFVALPAVAR